jgi:TRAP transporter 4TM/12TM fusion protein
MLSLRDTKSKKGIDWNIGREGRGQSPLEFFWTKTGFSPQRVVTFLLGGLSVALPIYIMYQMLFGTSETYMIRTVAVSSLLVLTFFSYPIGKRSWRDGLDGLFTVDVLCVLAVVFIQIYILVHRERFTVGTTDITLTDKVIGGVTVVLVLEGCRRTMGYAISAVGLFFLLHAYFANYFPGFLYGPPANITQLTESIFTSQGGIYGIAMGVMVEVMFVFLFFGAFLNDTSVGAFFISLANATTGRRVGGPAKAAVLSSGMVGTVTGSVVANVVVTGSVTIPMMKRLGYTAEFAGAVEAVASSGGQLMPPMMGVTAFLIAAFLGISYGAVCKHALIPAFLYFFSAYLVVHFRAKKTGLKSLDEENIPDLWLVVRQGMYLIIPLIVIVYLLVIGFSATYAALVGIGTVFALSFLRKETRLSARGWILSLENATRMSLPIGVGCAAIGIILGSLGASGIGFKFTALVVDFSGGQLWIGLLLAMVAAIILGMGVPTSLVYIFLVVLVIPALIKMGVNEVAAHLFAFYFGVIGNITPPVALGAFAAAGISGGNYFRTSLCASRIGTAAFIIPYMFVYFPELLLIGRVEQILIAVVTASIGVFCLASAIEGWIFTELRYSERLLQFIAALLLIKPGIYTDFAGLFLFAIVMGIQVYKKRSRAPGIVGTSAPKVTR